MDPQNAFAWQGLAMVYEAQGRWEESGAAWRQATRYDPRNPAVLFFLARALARTGNTTEALARIQESLEINSKSAQVYQLRAQIRIEQGQSWEGYWDWVRGCQFR
jgi:predicted Zn-dependent protease